MTINDCDFSEKNNTKMRVKKFWRGGLVDIYPNPDPKSQNYFRKCYFFYKKLTVTHLYKILLIKIVQEKFKVKNKNLSLIFFKIALLLITHFFLSLILF